MQRDPPVVGLTLNYRDPQRTARCVRSLREAGARAVLVWDNSDDGGRSAAALRELDPGTDLRIVTSASNLGFAAGVNRGLEAIARDDPGCWVMLLNNDACVDVQGIALLHAELRAQPQALFAYPCIDHGGRVIGTAWYQSWLGLITASRLPGSFAFPSGCALLIALARLPRADLFDERFFMYGEDVALGAALRDRPQAMRCVERVLVWHEGSASSGMGSPFYEARTVAAHLLLVGVLARRRLDAAGLYAGRMLALPARALLRAARYRSAEPLRALLAGFRLAGAPWRGSPPRTRGPG